MDGPSPPAMAPWVALAGGSGVGTGAAAAPPQQLRAPLPRAPAAASAPTLVTAGELLLAPVGSGPPMIGFPPPYVQQQPLCPMPADAGGTDGSSNGGSDRLQSQLQQQPSAAAATPVDPFGLASAVARGVAVQQQLSALKALHGGPAGAER